MELKQITTVLPGGRVEVTFPALSPGEAVEVVVRTNGFSAARSGAARAGFGFARGLIRVRDDFDQPLEDFEDCA